jgi:NADH:ubiquinone oxidoreductase subunit
LRVGPANYFRQLQNIGDTKYGTLVGVDVFGNKYFENTSEDEIHLRTRWVEYKEHFNDLSQVEPSWHFWLSYGVDVPPNKVEGDRLTVRKYPYKDEHYENHTGTPGAYVPYNTTRPKFASWQPKVQARA